MTRTTLKVHAWLSSLGNVDLFCKSGMCSDLKKHWGATMCLTFAFGQLEKLAN